VSGSSIGYTGKVSLGATKVLGLGNWELSGITADEMDDSEFGDEFKKYEFGQKDGATVKFAGLHKPGDTTGQDVLKVANLNNTDITTLRLYIDNTSYYEPCRTTGYFSPSLTTGQATQISHVNVRSFNVSKDKSGLDKVDFDCRVSGVMVLGVITSLEEAFMRAKKRKSRWF
jgi:hypothetical protein